MAGESLPYRDRTEAGQVLARQLESYRGAPGLIVLGLPRGGVPVAAEVARHLSAPLDVFIVRKLGHPLHGEYAIGAIASGGVRVLKDVPVLPVPGRSLEAIEARERQELARREALYRGSRPPLRVDGATVLVVDDGLATGATMEAAVQALRQLRPAHLCVAVPVGSIEACEALQAMADRVVCPARPEHFRAVSLWYRHFPQTGDEEVQQLLHEMAHAPAPGA